MESNTQPLFSIIIPTFNRADFILKVIKSIENQTFQDFEILIIDDGSTDNTENIIKPIISDRIHYYKKENGERAAARNFGTKKAKGKYINWFDSDDLALKNHLITAKIQIDNKAPEVFHLGYKINSSKGKTIEKFNNLPQNLSVKLYQGNVLSCNGVFVKKEIALNNLFNEERVLSVSEDYELWLRLASKYKIISNNTITSIIIQHEDRSVFKMSDPKQLISRYQLFIDLVTNNSNIQNYYGTKLKFLTMKNYLWLAVDLACHGHKELAKKHLSLSIKTSKYALVMRSYYATIKHIYFSKKK